MRVPGGGLIYNDMEKVLSIQDKNKHYHCITKGCVLKNIQITVVAKYIDTPDRYVAAQHCETHKIDCCRCGWEFGYHNKY